MIGVKVYEGVLFNIIIYQSVDEELTEIEIKEENLLVIKQIQE